eukprot:3440747-Ditylum_brightwellii.AAC.2
MFVANNTLMYNDSAFDASVNQFMTYVQYNAELWGHLLWVTGGLFEFLKSLYFLIVSGFKEDGSPEIFSALPDKHCSSY